MTDFRADLLEDLGISGTDLKSIFEKENEEYNKVMGVTPEDSTDEDNEPKSEVEETIDYIKERRENILSGNVNCIPFGFRRFEKILPGIEQAAYYLITANTKVGKTQLTDAMFVYSVVKYMYENPGKVDAKIFYFSLEMSKREKYLQMISHVLYVYSKGKVRISPKELRSASADKPLDEAILSLLEDEKYMEVFRVFEEIVVIIDDIKNPFGIYKFMRTYAKDNGTMTYKIVKSVNKNTGEITENRIFDKYIPFNSQLYVLFVVDHIALINAEKGGTKREAIIKLSSEYCVNLRNWYNFIPVIVVQQAFAQESNENIKLGRVRPTLDGIGDVKVIARDANHIIGLFSPSRHGMKTYMNYDITVFKDNIRFMEVIASREGGGNSLIPLYFDGAVNYFKELPKPTPENKDQMDKVYDTLQRIRTGNNILFLLINKERKNL